MRVKAYARYGRKAGWREIRKPNESGYLPSSNCRRLLRAASAEADRPGREANIERALVEEGRSLGIAAWSAVRCGHATISNAGASRTLACTRGYRGSSTRAVAILVLTLQC